MRARLVLALFVTALAVTPAHAVSGGATLPIAQAPYIAWVSGRCTGTLISPTRILTAAHCLDGQDVADAQVLVGVDGNTLTPGQVSKLAVPVRGYTVHPKFKESFPFAHSRPQDAIAVNDVGLILLKKPIRTIAPVRLAGAGDGALEAGGVAAAILGYGITAPETDTGVPRSPLQQGALNVLGASDCEKAYPRAIEPTMICTADLVNHAPPFVMGCPGDSGGPVIVQTPGGPVQIGVNSWGAEVMEVGCGLRPLPDVAMRVSSFASFIHRAKPVIQPHTTGPGFRHTSIVGVARIGNTVTCKPPKLAGAPLKLSYEWSVGIDTGGFLALRHAHKATLKITKAIYKSSSPPEGRTVFCIATARNAGGSLNTGLAGTRLRK
jgi:secreted trypsin-like serine protease